MPSTPGSLRLLTPTMLFLLSAAAIAQRPAPTSARNTSSAGYTLSAGTSLVVEDVSVTDKHGNPVTGLPRATFRVQDNGIPQQILSLREGGDMPASTVWPGQLPADSYSNASLYSGTGPVIAMLVDPVSMSLPEQMFLRLQMLHFLQSIPAGTQVTVFRTNSRGIPVLIQALTTDRRLLVAAVNQSIPTIPRPAALFSNGIAEIANISDYLQAVPGKKALLWFSGQFPLFLDPSLCSAIGPVTPTITSNLDYTDCGSLNGAMKQAFRALQQARIAVYPIDVRGVVVLGPPPPDAVLQGRVPSTEDPGSTVSTQYDLEDQLARATGGHAFFSDNGLASAMNEAVTLGEDSYTLAYQPEPYKTDGKWHKVRITVDGPYTVRYRTGYYAADSAAQPRPQLTTSGKIDPSVVAADRTPTAPGSIMQASAAGETPLVFSVHVQPQRNGGKAPRLLIEYTIPAAQLQFSAGAGGTAHARFRLAVLAYNTEGDVESQAMDTVETRFTPAQMATARRIGTPAEQIIDVRKGSQFLLLAVQDLQTERVGTVVAPLHDLLQPGH